MTQMRFNGDEQILGRFTVLDLAGSGNEAETGAVGAAVGDAGVRAIFGNLLLGLSDDGGAVLVDLEFPADDKSVRKKGAQSGNDFGSGHEFDQQVLCAGGNLARPDFRQRLPCPALPNFAEFEIIDCGCMEDGVDVGSGKRLQPLPQVIRSGEGFSYRSVALAAPRSLLADEERNAVTLGREEIDQFRTKPPRREVREAAHLIQRLEGRPGRDDTVHGLSLRDCPQKRYSVE